MTVWYEESFGHEYLRLYAHRDLDEARADIAAIVRLLAPPKDEPLLDLCCGACRHLLVLHEMGFTRLVGLDLSQELLEVGAEQLAGECAGPIELDAAADGGAEVTPGTVRLVQCDMRCIPYADHFATVLSLFTSFGYFGRDEENQSVLAAVHRALRAGGRFLIDYLNRDYVVAHLVERDEKVLPGRHVYNVRCLTEGCRRVEKTTTVVTEAGDKRVFHESVRLYSAAEMGEMLRGCGFVGIESYGSLDGEPFGSESPRLILIAEKARET
jgi:SAM-dependent methyltransferase